LDDVERHYEVGWVSRFGPRWPVRFLGPPPGLKELNLACWGLFVGFVVLPLLVPLWFRFRSGAGFSSILPVDFIYFYGDGSIVRSYPINRLYDYSLQLKTFNDIFPFHDGAYGPSPYPPFVGLFFSLFARLPFWPAYLAWLGVSMSLYLIGIWAVAKVIFPTERLKSSLVFCFALAFYPFTVGTLANGQLATVAVFSIGVAIFFEARSRFFVSGLALSILAYKPTLLLILLPMLLLTRRFRTMLGFCTGAAGLMLATTMVVGAQIWPAYAHFLASFGRTAGVSGNSALRLWKYVDFSSFMNAMVGGRSWIALAILLAVAGGFAAVLGVMLWHSATMSQPGHYLAWAATLTWTLLLNVYVPIYDTVLVTIAVVLTLGAVRMLAWDAAERWTVLLALLIFAASWNTAALSKTHGTQYMTLLLTILGSGQLYGLYRMTGKEFQPDQAPGTAIGPGGGWLGWR
jgi:hypothetical protein